MQLINQFRQLSFVGINRKVPEYAPDDGPSASLCSIWGMQHHRDKPSGSLRRRGFTLIELFIVISVIAVLVALLLPAVQQARESARRTQCRNNLMQIGLALRNYESAHECLPPGSIDPNRPIQNDGKGYNFGWIVQILPQLEQGNLYEQLDFSVSVYDKRNALASSPALPGGIIFGSGSVLSCHSDPGSMSDPNYAGCHHDVEAPIDIDNNGVLFLNSSIRRDDIFDGASNTIFVGEHRRSGDGLGWFSGTRATLRNTGTPINAGNVRPGGAMPIPPPPKLTLLEVGGFSSYHVGGANFVLGDGSVRYINQMIPMSIFTQLGNRADGNLPAGDY